jgi:hypothetical protein
MSYKNQINEHDAGEVLLSLLTEGKLLSESKATLIESKIDILLNESTGSTPSVYNFKILNKTTNDYEEFSVTWKQFWDVYADLSNYKSYRDILVAVGVPESIIKQGHSKLAGEKVTAMAAHFSKTFGNKHLIPLKLDYSPAYGMGRNEFFTELKYNNLNDVPTYVEGNVVQVDKDAIAKEKGFEDPEEYLRSLSEEEPEKDDILFGTRGRDSSRTGRIIDSINKEELFPGEFYSNMSRIPKPSLFNWLRLWKKDTVGLKSEGSFLGRKWKKIFIMGYQVDKNFLFEIWFNTIDSTYTLHDHRGGELSKRSKTLAEVMKSLFLQLAKRSPKDVEFLQNPTDKTVVDSFLRAMRQDIDTRTDDMLAREKAEAEKATKEAEKKKKEREEFKKKIKDIKRDVFNISDFEKRDMKDVEVKIGSEVRQLKKWEKEAVEKKVEKARQQLQADKISKQEYEEIIKQIQQNIYDVIKGGVKSAEDDFFGAADNVYPMNRSRVNDTFKKARAVNEQFDITEFSRQKQMADEFASEIADETGKPAYNNRVSKIRQEADRDSINFKKLQATLMNTIVKYTDETRMGRYAPTIFDRIISSGRKDKVVYPTDKPSIWNRVKNFLRGTRYRADFVAGYSLADRVDFEIWYVTEPNPNYDENSDPVKLISSFYVYDLSSGLLVRKYIPYYRNAEQIVLQKIGTIS